MKTFPQNHNNSITIPSSRYLRHDCICCFANPATRQPKLATLPLPPFPISAREEFSVCISLGMCGKALSSAFYTHSSPRVPPSTTRDEGNSHLTCSYGAAILWEKKVELLKKHTCNPSPSGPLTLSDTHWAHMERCKNK